MKENDILLGRFADHNIQKLNHQQLDDFEILMQQNDIDIMNWVIGKTAVPEEFNTKLMILIQIFNKPK